MKNTSFRWILYAVLSLICVSVFGCGCGDDDDDDDDAVSDDTMADDTDDADDDVTDDSDDAADDTSDDDVTDDTSDDTGDDDTSDDTEDDTEDDTSDDTADDDTTDYSLDFDGIDGKGQTAGAMVPDITSDFTVEGWFYFDLASPAFSEALIGQIGTVVDKAIDPPGFYLERDAGTNEVYFCVCGSGVFRCSDGDAQVNDGDWVHIAGTWEGATGKVQSYTNGQSGDSLTSGALYSESDGYLTVGAAPGGASLYFTGRMDMVRISKALRYSGDFTPATDYGVDEDTIAMYTFNETVGTTAHDLTVNGNDLFLTGGVTWHAD